MSRQQRGGINLHRNLLVASVLHKARTTYMMDNFQTLLANKRAQAEREAAAKMIVETPVAKSQDTTCSESMEKSFQTRGVIEYNKPAADGAPNGGQTEIRNKAKMDKENIVPTYVNKEDMNNNTPCDKSEDLEQKSCSRDLTNSTPMVFGKQPLSANNGSTNYVSQLPSCRCVGNKRQRSVVSECESATEPKKPRYDDEDSKYCDSESEYESDSGEHQRMQTDSTQVTSLVDIFSTGFNGLCKDNELKQPSGQINVYVSADRPVSGHQYVLTDMSCGTQLKDSVAIPTGIALAV
ncbi:uncharacterized protein LOC128223422 [Mya arenaria]|uniref:uncharacterized protein LOC128223422 n=1 Tax=Mya arenaria TaxID=6604 RepID=UPI0022E3ED00|nr:uncharacterized protein LOC128223422 [Mya arenaria]